MSVGLTESRQGYKLKGLDTRFDQTERRERAKRRVNQPVTSASDISGSEVLKKECLFHPHPTVTRDDEIAFVTKAVLWMACLSITPLILFLICYYFNPEQFLDPISPN